MYITAYCYLLLCELLLLLELHCTALQNSWRTMRHWSGQCWHCDELLLEAIMQIYIIPWHLASHSTHYQRWVSCLRWVFECAYMHVRVCVHVKLSTFPWHLALLSTWCSAERGNVRIEFYKMLLLYVFLYIYVCLFLCQKWNTVIKGGGLPLMCLQRVRRLDTI